jgi:hypothetical protein
MILTLFQAGTADLSNQYAQRQPEEILSFLRFHCGNEPLISPQVFASAHHTKEETPNLLDFP